MLVSGIAGGSGSGKTIQQPVYSYITCSRSTTETVTVEPAEE